MYWQSNCFQYTLSLLVNSCIAGMDLSHSNREAKFENAQKYMNASP